MNINVRFIKGMFLIIFIEFILVNIFNLSIDFAYSMAYYTIISYGLIVIIISIKKETQAIQQKL